MCLKEGKTTKNQASGEAGRWKEEKGGGQRGRKWRGERREKSEGMERSRRERGGGKKKGKKERNEGGKERDKMEGMHHVN